MTRPGTHLPIHVGTCTCGRIEVRLFSALTPADFQPRSDAATCRFCTEHDGVWISDPSGVLELRAGDETRRERFGSEQVEFHFCPTCSDLVYATFEHVAVVRVALFAAIRAAALPTVATNFENETVEVGCQRRLAKWTSVRRT